MNVKFTLPEALEAFVLEGGGHQGPGRASSIYSVIMMLTLESKLSRAQRKHTKEKRTLKKGVGGLLELDYDG